LRAGTLALENKDFDTGKPTTAGEYLLTDEAYATLLDKLKDHKFADANAMLRANILAFYQSPTEPLFDRKKPGQRDKTLKDLEELRSLQVESKVAREPIRTQ
jgi:hypothetical protein